MLARKNRLDLRSQRPRGRRLGGKYFNLELLKFEATQEPKFAVIVSKKVAKKAVDRNRLRRLFAEAIQPLLSRLPNGLGAIIYAKPAAVGVHLGQLEQELRVLLGL